jgi:hypothetical protein
MYFDVSLVKYNVVVTTSNFKYFIFQYYLLLIYLTVYGIITFFKHVLKVYLLS